MSLLSPLASSSALPPPHVLAEARGHLARGWAGVVDAALLAPAWALPEAPLLADCPDAAWGDYTRWLLTTPTPDVPVGADGAALIARHLTRRFEELAVWFERNLAAAPVRAAADAFLGTRCPPLADLPADSLLPLQRARARILARLHGQHAPLPLLAATPRTGRALRVGFLKTRFDATPGTFAALARFAQLDPLRFEVRLFAHETDYSACESHCADRAAEFVPLPATLGEQLETLRAARLDVLVFADDLAAHPFPHVHLALHRLAPLQFSLGATTTGLPGIDFLLAGEDDSAATEPGNFSERLALVPETAHAFDFEPDRAPELATWTRMSLGLPEGAPLFVTAADDSSPLTAATLARLRDTLAASPAATLLLLGNSSHRDALLALGVSASQLHLHDPSSATVSELQSLLAVADLALDPPPAAAALALEAGLPVLASCESPAAALLRSAGLTGFVIDSDERFAQHARDIVATPGSRQLARQEAEAAFARFPRFADTYAAAQDFADVLEAAHDELLGHGPRALRKRRAPLRPSVPRSIQPARLHEEGRELLNAGRPERAVPCLLSALQRAGDEAALWFDLARAYRDAGQPHSAVESLEASLRLDADNAPAWVMMCELATDVGSLDFAREALSVAAGLGSDDPRLPDLRLRLSA